MLSLPPAQRKNILEVCIITATILILLYIKSGIRDGSVYIEHCIKLQTVLGIPSFTRFLASKFLFLVIFSDLPVVNGEEKSEKLGENHRLTPRHWQLFHMTDRESNPGSVERQQAVSGNALDLTAMQYSTHLKNPL